MSAVRLRISGTAGFGMTPRRKRKCAPKAARSGTCLPMGRRQADQKCIPSAVCVWKFTDLPALTPYPPDEKSLMPEDESTTSPTNKNTSVHSRNLIAFLVAGQYPLSCGSSPFFPSVIPMFLFYRILTLRTVIKALSNSFNTYKETCRMGGPNKCKSPLVRVGWNHGTGNKKPAWASGFHWFGSSADLRPD